MNGTSKPALEAIVDTAKEKTIPAELDLLSLAAAFKLGTGDGIVRAMDLYIKFQLVSQYSDLNQDLARKEYHRIIDPNNW